MSLFGEHSGGNVTWSEATSRGIILAWETILPETAKALSAPVTKLIKVAASGCGKLYEPTGIRRRAQAEGDALVILEEARARASEVSQRAAQRLLDVEERRQRNIEAIVQKAVPLLPNEVSATPVEDDWSSRFFAEVQDIGNEEMQTVWAKLLAGEVAKPGSFSPRTMFVVKNLAPREAELFNTLCKVSFREAGDDPAPFYGVGDKNFWDELGLGYVQVQGLQDAGLIFHEPLGLERRNFHQSVLRGPDLSVLLQAEGPATLEVGKVGFTVAGLELSRICEWAVPEVRVRDMAKAMKSPIKGVVIRVLERTEGNMRYEVVDK